MARAIHRAIGHAPAGLTSESRRRPMTAGDTDYPQMAAARGRIEPAPRRVRGYLGHELVFDTTAARYVWEVRSRERFAAWHEGQARLAAPGHDKGLVGRLRSALDNRRHDIRPEALAAAVDRAAADDAIFTSDTGMATVWLSRFVEMRGSRRLLGSYNLGSMANAMPQALGAQCLDRGRQVVAFCGDGGLSMLLGDLMTLKTQSLPVKLVVFDNRRLGMVKLEQEQAGLPEFGTVLDNPDFAAVARAMGLTGIRVTDPGELEDAVRTAFATPGPSCSTCSPTRTRWRSPPNPPSNRAGASPSPR